MSTSNQNRTSSAQDTLDAAKAAAAHAGEAVADAAEELGDRASKAGHRFARKAKSGAQRLLDEDLADDAQHAVRYARGYAEQFGQSLSAYVAEQPLKAVAIAVGVGAILAFALGPRRR